MSRGKCTTRKGSVNIARCNTLPVIGCNGLLRGSYQVFLLHSLVLLVLAALAHHLAEKRCINKIFLLLSFVLLVLAALDLHESGTTGYALKRTSTAIGFYFLFFIFLNLIRVQNSEPLHAKMNPTSCLYGSWFACAQTSTFSAEQCSKNAEEPSIVLLITAHE